MAFSMEPEFIKPRLIKKHLSTIKRNQRTRSSSPRPKGRKKCRIYKNFERSRVSCVITGVKSVRSELESDGSDFANDREKAKRKIMTITKASLQDRDRWHWGHVRPTIPDPGTSQSTKIYGRTLTNNATIPSRKLSQGWMDGSTFIGMLVLLCLGRWNKESQDIDPCCLNTLIHNCSYALRVELMKSFPLFVRESCHIKWILHGVGQSHQTCSPFHPTLHVHERTWLSYPQRPNTGTKRLELEESIGCPSRDLLDHLANLIQSHLWVHN